MKVTMVMLSSVDGRTTKGDQSDIYVWTSLEDQDYFFSLIKKSKVIIMGAKTYEAVRSRLKLEEKKLRIVLTRHPEKYKSHTILGQLEFSSEKPQQLLERLNKLKYKKALLVGGGIINGLFLKQNLVNEFFLTIEPRIFGEGKNVVEGQLLDKSLQLMSMKKLNEAGTLLLRYKVNK